jgi:hypothetical protein
VLGVPPDSLVVTESEGNSWYNGLEVSLTKRSSHGLQLLASYTFSKTLDTDGADINSTASGNALTGVRFLEDGSWLRWSPFSLGVLLPLRPPIPTTSLE